MQADLRLCWWYIPRCLRSHVTAHFFSLKLIDLLVFQFLYSISDGDESTLEFRVTELLDLMKEAAMLREQKVYSTPDHSNSKAFSRRKYVFIHSSCYRVPKGPGKHGKPEKSLKKVPCMEKSWNLKKTE